MDTETAPNDRHLQAIIEARRAAESAICIAMVTSWIPGLEVTYLDEPDPFGG